MSVTAVLFDKDGTLTDFHAMWLPAYQSGARLLAGMADDPALKARLLALGGYDAATQTLTPDGLLAVGTTGEIISTWLHQSGLDSGSKGMVAGVTEALNQIFHAYATHAPRPTTDLPALFGRMRARGMTLGVATMDSTEAARVGLRKLAVEHLVDFIAGYDAGHGVKPGPGMVQGFTRAFGLHTSNVAMVGDTVGDLQMGRAAEVGMCIGVLTGIDRHEQLAEWADVVIPSIADLESVLP